MNTGSPVKSVGSICCIPYIDEIGSFISTPDKLA